MPDEVIAVVDSVAIEKVPDFAKAVQGMTIDVSVDDNVGVPSASVTKSQTEENLIFDINFHNLKGNGVTDVSLISEVGLNKTYRITTDSGDTFDLELSDGRGITGISWEESGTAGDGKVHTGTISYNDGTSSTIVITDGLKGDTGATGATPNISVGSVTTGDPGTSADVTIGGTTASPVLYFTIPRGATGETGSTGPAGAVPSFSIGEVTSGSPAAATITGTDANPVLNLTLPQGDTGAMPEISIGTVTTGAAGSSAAVTITGTDAEPVLNFTIPKGDTGATGATGATGPAGADGQDGATGATPELSIGTVTTGAAGSSAAVTITGTTAAPVLNFTIPKGDKGDTGATGDVPDGGTAGQVLAKHSSANQDTEWVDQSGGVFLITVTYSNSTYTSDKTYDEIENARTSGQCPIIRYDGKYYPFSNLASSGGIYPYLVFSLWDVYKNNNYSGSGNNVRTNTFSIDRNGGLTRVTYSAGNSYVYGVPSGGSADQVLGKRSSSDGDIGWADMSFPGFYCGTAASVQTKQCTGPGFPLPANGCYFLLYMKNANSYAGAVYLSIPNGSGSNVAKQVKINYATGYTLPAGQYLVYYDGTYCHINTQGKIPYVLPSGGTLGQVLTKMSDSDNGSAAWTTPHYVPYGGTSGQVLTKSSGTDYDVSWTTPSGGGGGGDVFFVVPYNTTGGELYNAIQAEKLVLLPWSALQALGYYPAFDGSNPFVLCNYGTDYDYSTQGYYATSCKFQRVSAYDCLTAIEEFIISTNGAGEYYWVDGQNIVSASMTVCCEVYASFFAATTSDFMVTNPNDNLYYGLIQLFDNMNPYGSDLDFRVMVTDGNEGITYPFTVTGCKRHEDETTNDDCLDIECSRMAYSWGTSTIEKEFLTIQFNLTNGEAYPIGYAYVV